MPDEVEPMQELASPCLKHLHWDRPIGQSERDQFVVLDMLADGFDHPDGISHLAGQASHGFVCLD
jgi:hypothetical protein